MGSFFSIERNGKSLTVLADETPTLPPQLALSQPAPSPPPQSSDLKILVVTFVFGGCLCHLAAQPPSPLETLSPASTTTVARCQNSSTTIPRHCHPHTTRRRSDLATSWPPADSSHCQKPGQRPDKHSDGPTAALFRSRVLNGIIH
ncbi:hypothetical protein Droror1_Dr00015106 [Drosera rotundifolia]